MRLKKNGNKFCLDKISQVEMECICAAMYQTFLNDFDPESVVPSEDGSVNVSLGVGIALTLTDELDKFGLLSDKKMSTLK